MPPSAPRRPTFGLLLAAGSAALALVSAVALTGEVRLVLIVTLFFSGFGAGVALGLAIATQRQVKRASRPA